MTLNTLPYSLAFGLVSFTLFVDDTMEQQAMLTPLFWTHNLHKEFTR
jgi:hypothetical protein